MGKENSSNSSEFLCPCYSGSNYAACCQSFHTGSDLPANAMLLMRSRYAAYALHLPEYIIQTTHLKNPRFSRSTQEVLAFCKQTQFIGLQILDFKEELNTATVTFIAQLMQNQLDVSFKEKSLFKKEKEQWLYLDCDSIGPVQIFNKQDNF